jgi:glycosyltransferase involved in cell wall biosynthesis
MIIVDDGSTDKTVSIIKLAARDCRIKFFRIRKNVGTGITRNTALYKANGRYIFLDADDLDPNKLEILSLCKRINYHSFRFTTALMKRETPKQKSGITIKFELPTIIFCNYWKSDRYL